MGDKLLERYSHFVDALGLTLGKNCEVVLHDFRKPHSSIVRIANNQVTGRNVGDPATDLILSHLSKNENLNSIVGYKTKSPKGADLKSTTMFIRNYKNKVIGALCINIDLTPYQETLNILNNICDTAEKSDPNEVFLEKFETDIEVILSQMLEQNINEIGRPAIHMEKENKLHLIRKLRSKGFFLIKGSAKRVSEELNVALPTIYKYLEEVGG